MPTDTSVKFLHSAMVGAPSLAGQAGSLIALLDACLVNGFNLVTVDSIVIAGGIGTITRGAGLAFEVGAVALIAGANVTGGTVNGAQKILSATGTTATFDATGLADQAATGAPTAKMAPLGWAKTYAGTNLAAYKPTDVTATGCMLRVDDTGTTTARARGYETMSDVNTGAGLFPSDANVSGGLYWPKSSTADGTTRPWVLVGDGRVFYLLAAFTASSPAFGFNAVFGDIASVKSPDAYACLIHGLATSALGAAGNNNSADFDFGDGAAVYAGTYLARGYAGLGSNISARKAFSLIAGSGSGRSGQVGLPYPNYADGGVYLTPMNVIDHATGVFRGSMPGLFAFPQFVSAGVFGNRDSLTGVSGYGGLTFKIINSAGGCLAFDTSGPWR